MSAAPTCTNCGGATGGAFLCRRCGGKLERDLGDMPALLAELEVTASRQDRGTGTPLYAPRHDRVQQPGRDYAEGTTTLPATPWEFGWDAANLLATAVNTLSTWTRHLCEQRGLQPPAATRGRWTTRTWRTLYVDRNRMHIRSHWQQVFVPAADQPVRAIVLWLIGNIEAIRQDEAADQAYDQITWLHRAIEAQIDQSEPDEFLGRCDAVQVGFEPDGDGDEIVPVAQACGVRLYGHRHDREVRCTGCGTHYRYDERKAELESVQLDDQLARAHLIADALSSVDDGALTRERLRKWIQRDAAGGPTPHGPACNRACRHPTCRLVRRPPVILAQGVDDEGRPLYRVGDVRARMAAVDTATRSADRLACA